MKRGRNLHSQGLGSRIATIEVAVGKRVVLCSRPTFLTAQARGLTSENPLGSSSAHYHKHEASSRIEEPQRDGFFAF